MRIGIGRRKVSRERRVIAGRVGGEAGGVKEGGVWAQIDCRFLRS
jgi:hypothetical protein